jgi:ketosteroid isomerase-like protein
MTSDASLLERLDRLERKLQRLDSIDSIKNLHRTYIRKLADRDWEGMADFFTDDATTDIRWHGRTEGKQELVEKVFSVLHGMVKSHDGYILSSPVVTVADDGETADGEWTWHRHVCEFRTTGGFTRVWGPWLEGRYKCQYRFVEGRWLFSDMWFRVVLPDRDPEADEMEARTAAGEHVIGTGMLAR